MLFTDWVVMLFTLGAIVAYGVYKGREKGSVSAYMQAGKRLPWYMVLLGVMATQASAITFLSAPGQAYYDGMRFVQYYFGLPLAMIVICVSFIPQYTKLNVITAYEFIEKRFDKRMRLLTAFLFLLSRGLSTGISIYAPAIVLSSILGIPLVAANFLTGGLLLVYTLSGGAQAIAHTQKLQFILILIFIIFTGIYLASNLPHHLTLNDALAYSRSAGKMNTVTTTFSWKDKYNMWSGIIGGFFLALSYFGTDQSQVARYVNAKDAGQSKTGLLLNGLVKIPMQFFILFIGVLLYVFYSFSTPPISYNTTAWAIFEKAEPAEARQWQAAYQSALSEKQHQQAQLLTSPSTAYQSYNAPITALHDSLAKVLYTRHYSHEQTDSNYIFLYYITHQLPPGLVGILIAVIILASWGSISAAINALAASSLFDLHLYNKEAPNEKELLYLCRLHTVGWGLFSMGVAMFAGKQNSLIEAVNVLGSLFYGTLLGIFLVALYLPKIQPKSVFYAAIGAEIAVVVIYFCEVVSFLWLNVIGALLVIVLGSALQWLLPKPQNVDK